MPESRAIETAQPFLPSSPRAGLQRHRQAVQSCRGCDLYKNATQAVFGEGIPTARIMLIGEQPGDQEDLRGRVFVGPAGKMLDRALLEIGLDRTQCYVTNAVKHFKWTPRGKRRLHQRPTAREVHACFPWLKREIEIVKPSVMVCMGATACLAILGNQFRLTRSRGVVIRDPNYSAVIIATIHPSAILRAPDHAGREQAYRGFVHDLKLARATAQAKVSRDK